MALDVHLGFSPVSLGLAWIVVQGNGDVRATRSLLTDVVPDRGLTAQEAELSDQSLEDAVGRVALLGRSVLVLPKPLVDDRYKWP